VHRPRSIRLRSWTSHWLASSLSCVLAVSCRLDSDALNAYPRNEAPGGAEARAGVSSPAVTDPAHGAEPSGPRRELAAVSRGGLWATWNSLRGDAYELDDIDRVIGDGDRIACHPQGLVDHRGQLLPYQGAVRVDPAFRERLVRFEQLVVEVATEVYGRVPARLRHFGAYSCRSTRNHTRRMSEHALGNAIDVVGFDFARAKKNQPLAAGLPAELKGPFQVRVARHWTPDEKHPAAAIHGRFLHELAARLGDRSDVFRGMIGPSRSDHTDHLHLDMSPWRYVYF
jgi:extensin-like protein